MSESAVPREVGAHRTATRRDVFKYALAPVLLGGLAPLAAMSTAPPSSAAGIQLIDFAERRIAPEEIKAAGYAGVVNYVSECRPGANFEAKPLTRAYADSLRAAGLHIVSNYQYGKPGWPNAPSDYTRGYDGGVADARTAQAIHAAAGGPGSAPIFFSVDEDINQGTWNDVALQWFRGINSVLGVERTGIYGHANACAWAIRDGVIGRSSTPGHWWAWQTIAWSHGVREPGAVLLQSVVEGPVLGGIVVDVDDVLADDFGQWAFVR
ncbi:twin-arginine translocation pathway signal [Mycobacterium intermedium]|uniref:Twin-arginine translocation pathway signal n=1 Tax=Mycobacterium intermedium TaxID=28445 RepID=A0A1E3SEX3_MYCIE|nr:DUF1906 domain-containing protein [Mycobacterium intermedium]MCV6963127.1 DUF1906 domain-containing protein [Mycobacterium intermedium]ODR00716.1 twin-arginine translocation pathway signal [Mycobacterium intermedium]OPE52336.1 twin-arginine translocation pathway signal [Mycobacterium intermedium]ORB03663.1 twin-arginine translocation pathway signal [Mycobacterium intermedium]